MAIYRIQNTLQDIDGLSKDRYVNTYYVASITPLNAEVDNLTTVNGLVMSFYLGMQSYLGAVVGGAGHTVKAYDMSQPPNLRPPIAPITYSLTSSGSSFPAEVAMAITLEATPVEGIQPMSTRGRIFLGPLSIATTQESVPVGAGARPSADFRAAALTQMNTLIEGIKGVQASLRLVVASTVANKTRLPNGSRKAYEVVACSVDDAWDTQRSRGNAPTMRTRTTNNTNTGFTMTW